jgi:hypothetical protein
LPIVRSPLEPQLTPGCKPLALAQRDAELTLRPIFVEERFKNPKSNFIFIDFPILTVEFS